MSNTQDNNRPDHDQSGDHDPRSPLEVDINVDPTLNETIDESRLREAVIQAARFRHFHSGNVGIRVTDDESIQTLNCRHMGHDYPTDVISFGYSQSRPHLEGEMVISADTARRQANQIGWSRRNELLLYVIHGTLHITGMDDRNPSDRRQMRAAERDVLMRLGIEGMDRFGADVLAASSAGGPPASTTGNKPAGLA